MNARVLKHLSVALLTAVVISANSACSTQKNTSFSRFYHATLTRYNTYYNGRRAFDEGYSSQEKAVKDNYLEILDVFPISDEDARKTGTGSFDRAAEKAQKCITLHSIKKKPAPGKEKKKSAQVKKNEYNPFLWHAWMLLADSQFQKGEFLEAAGTYSYICRLYGDELYITARAMMKTAQCYSELDWFYEADEIFARMSADSIPLKLGKEFSAIKASHLLRQQRYGEALDLLVNAGYRQKESRMQKIREEYLAGQLYKEEGNMEESYRHFRKVIRMNPPYQVEFNARIQQTETMPAPEAGTISRKLQRMTRDPNNRKYLDQIYYALGNVQMSCGDTLKALELYEKGLVEGTERTPERGVLLLHTASVYWDRHDYRNAGRCYTEAVGIIGQSHPDYSEVMLRSAALGDLSQHISQIELQDSLRFLSTLPDSLLYPILDRVIEDLIISEAEAEKLAEKEERNAAAAKEMSTTSGGENNGEWYFYNSALVREGTAMFNRTWGKRKLEDDWRRRDRTVTIDIMEDTGLEDGSPDAESDSVAAPTEAPVTVISNDPHTREYYIAQIPYTEVQKRESDSILSDALFNAGIIYKDELSEYVMAERVLHRTVTDFPQGREADDALYNLYLMYSLWNRPGDALQSKQELTEKYPESEYAIRLSDPLFEENVRFGRHREDSLYQVAYRNYRANRTDSLLECCRISAEKYPAGSNRSKFMFLEAIANLSSGNTERCLEILKKIVQDFPEGEIGQLSANISRNANQGRLLQSGSFGSIWDRRNGIGQDTVVTDSLRPEFSTDRYAPFMVVMVYPEESLNENQLLFETASYNFSRYMMRNFGIDFRHEQGIGMMTIGEFLNFDEAYLYRKRMYETKGMSSLLEGINTLIITDGNLTTLLRYYSFNEYQEFFSRNFLSIPEMDIDGNSIDEELSDEE